MAQNTKAKKKTTKNTGNSAKTEKTAKPDVYAVERKQLALRKIAALLFAALGFLTVLGWFSNEGAAVRVMCNILKGFSGWGFWLYAPAFFLAAIVLAFGSDRAPAWRAISALLVPVFIGALADLLFSKTVLPAEGIFRTLFADGKAMYGGGVLGGGLAYYCEKALGTWGAGIVFFVLFTVFSLSACGVTLIKLKHAFGDAAKPKHLEESKTAKTEEIKQETPKKRERRTIDIPLDDFDKNEDEKPFAAQKRRVKPEAKKAVSKTDDIEPLTVEEAAEIAGVKTPVTLSGNGTTAAAEIADPPKITKEDIAEEKAAITEIIASADNDGAYERPPIFLLKKGHATAPKTDEEILENRDRLESTIRSFGVNATIVSTTHGPTVTRYDFELEQGVKLSRLTNLANDIALALGVMSVRIAPVQGKSSTVGIEVPNKLISTVYLRDIVDSPKFAGSRSNLTFAVGKDIGGEPVVGNVSKLPHLLIAGTTGSGKSVCINSLIISLLYKSDPEDVKLIMIDPKMVELGVYNGIPQLYIPVVTDPKKAAGALQWAVTEMLKRYRLFSEVGVRQISTYNDYLVKNDRPKLPSIVIVIDELADLMMVASKEVEDSICRIAQLGRAAGMHLIVATQRPSADVITGLMKANIPSRIAFAVSSALESRIILDCAGAEKLIGNGDMLYAPIGGGKPLRVQGAFVSDEERDQVVSFIKEQRSPDYSDEIMAQIEKNAEQKKGKDKVNDSEPEDDPAGDFDELLPQAVDVIFDTKQASVSMLQRRLKLGYSRAARIVDQMEELGIIGPFEGSKPRQIIITREQWMEMQLTHGTAPTEMLRTQVEFADDTE